MYKSTGYVHAGTMNSTSANTTLAALLPVASLPAIPKFQVGYSPGTPGSYRGIEIQLMSSADSDSMTCDVWQAKRIVSARGAVQGFVFSKICSIACDCYSDTTSVFGDAAGASGDVYIGAAYTATTSTEATSPRGVGSAVVSAYGGSISSFSVSTGAGGRVIISDVGGAEFLLFDVYGGSGADRHVFVEGVV